MVDAMTCSSGHPGFGETRLGLAQTGSADVEQAEFLRYNFLSDDSKCCDSDVGFHCHHGMIQ